MRPQALTITTRSQELQESFVFSQETIVEYEVRSLCMGQHVRGEMSLANIDIVGNLLWPRPLIGKPKLEFGSHPLSRSVAEPARGCTG